MCAIFVPEVLYLIRTPLAKSQRLAGGRGRYDTGIGTVVLVLVGCSVWLNRV